MTAGNTNQPLSETKKALFEIRRLREQLAEANRALHAPVAIVGAGMRFPGGVRNAEQYWQLLVSGTDAIRDIPGDRWDVDAFYDPDRENPGTMYTRAGGFIDDVDRFDPQFFGIAPREAESMDPQHRLALEVAWEALEDAGIAPAGMAGSRGGVFLGLSNSDYARLVFADPRTPDTSAATGNNSSVAAGRISYLLGLQGPAMVVDTACSSSLVALHLAVQSLRRGECDFALAGGVNLILTPEMHVNFCRTQMLSADGRCKTFDASADGYSRGEGCGFIVLRRLDDAVQRVDRILAVVRGSAVNQDGHSAGLTAPNGVSQEAVIRDALADAGIEADSVGYVEAHGTGTPLGDPIEARALGAVYGQGRDPSTPLIVGSVKTNIGHLEAAAGIAGIIKTALALEHGTVPPLLHFRRANPEIPLADLGLRIASDAIQWPENVPRVAGVSSFGFSGTNAHVLIEASPPVVHRDADDPPECVLALSARSEGSLQEMQRQYSAFLSRTTRAFADVASTSCAGRSHFEYRLAVVATSPSDARRKLDASGADASIEQRRGFVPSGLEAPRVVFLFPGQGAQHAGMGAALYHRHGVFREAVDEAVGWLDDETGGAHLLDVMFDTDGAGRHLDETRYTQPAVFVMGYALWKLWQSWGVVPDVVLGHSLGEYMAAHAAGAIGLQDAARLVSARARLSATLPPGAMAAVFAGEAAVQQAIAGTGSAVDIAATNGPDNTVISGTEDGVAAVITALEQAGTEWRRLRISNAFHSRQLDPILDAFAELTSGVTHLPASVALLSNLSGEFVSASGVLPPDYWIRHLRNPVRFAAAIERLEPDARTIFIEVGPQPVLLGMVERIAPQSVLVPSMSRSASEWTTLMESVASLYVNGVDPDWSAIYRTSGDAPRRSPVALPTYPFRRDRYWIASPERGKSSGEQSGVAWGDVVRAGTRASSQCPLNLNVEELPAAWRALRKVTTTAIASAVATLGIAQRAGTEVSVESAIQDAGILPTYGHLFRRWLSLLDAEGLVRFDRPADRFTMRPSAAPADAQQALGEARRCFARELFLVDYIERCASMLPDVVTGKTPALETLFPDGEPDTAEKLYTTFSVSRYISGIASAAVAAKIGSHTRPLRVLEIGAGTGGTTAAVLPAMPGARTTYCFTDISDYFLAQAANRFSEYAFVEYRLLDIGSDIEAQGYRQHEFDVVIATNVLHATPDLRRTLGNVLSLLAGDGVLVLCEVTRELEWYDISTGLIEGWQSFDDDLRDESPMLAADTWKGILSEAGFSDVVALPEQGSPADAVGQSVILALAPAGERSAAAGDSGHKQAASVSIESTQQPAFRSRLLDAPDEERFDLLVEHVLTLVTAILRLPERPDARAGLFDLGLDSLMALDFRRKLAASLDLDAKLPATLIFDCPNAEAIARHLESEWLQLPADPVQVAPAAGPTSGTLSDDELAALSDEEVEALLARRLESGTGR